ncbi:uncharacterized protein LOC118429491 [Branchiostoma floridae]|uniref:Uncharacterized protein LOC118429491 n=2 Tax=Branchiostoma TaxID=7737 RepID=A0A9J7N7D3_BRAFL|nr:uncharacterized protein LOC118429491 [Branchiostoma floridae]XP_035695883.1 uncharacterized protein LOC118429491 [Branchiostoma floridae]KAI8494869.1 hypothetical protein Bbelb_274740 [Branchiostoma belcheri]CAH1273904.1 Hypp5222 [Branchiostoma lanceolatum]
MDYALGAMAHKDYVAMYEFMYSLLTEKMEKTYKEVQDGTYTEAGILLGTDMGRVLYYLPDCVRDDVRRTINDKHFRTRYYQHKTNRPMLEYLEGVERGIETVLASAVG